MTAFIRLLNANQLARFAFGIALLALALWIRNYDNQTPQIVASICSDTQNDFFCQFVKFGLEGLGLGAVWRTLIGISIFYIVLYDWIVSTFRELFTTVVDQATNVKDIATQQIRSHRLRRDELQEIFAVALSNSKSVPEEYGEDFGRFVFAGVGRRPFPIWRRAETSNVVIEHLDATHRFSEKYMRYRETRNFSVICSQGSGECTFPFKFAAYLECGPNDIEEIVANFSFVVRYPDEQINFADVAQGVDFVFVRGNGWKKPPFSIQHHAGVLTIRVEEDIPLKQKETTISATETSLILKSDKEYVKHLLEPTKELNFTFSVPEGHSVISCVASPDTSSWHPDRTSPTVDIKVRDVQVTCRNWVLPGIGLVIVWR